MVGNSWAVHRPKSFCCTYELPLACLLLDFPLTTWPKILQTSHVFHHSSIPLDLLHQPLFAPSHHLKIFLKNDIEASNARFCSYKFVEKQKKSLASKNLTSTYITFVCNLVPDHEKASLCIARFTHSLFLSLVFLLVFQLWANRPDSPCSTWKRIMSSAPPKDKQAVWL